MPKKKKNYKFVPFDDHDKGKRTSNGNDTVNYTSQRNIDAGATAESELKHTKPLTESDQATSDTKVFVQNQKKLQNGLQNGVKDTAQVPTTRKAFINEQAKHDTKMPAENKVDQQKAMQTLSISTPFQNDEGSKPLNNDQKRYIQKQNHENVRNSEAWEGESFLKQQKLTLVCWVARFSLFQLAKMDKNEKTSRSWDITNLANHLLSSEKSSSTSEDCIGSSHQNQNQTDIEYAYNYTTVCCQKCKMCLNCTIKKHKLCNKKKKYTYDLASLFKAKVDGDVTNICSKTMKKMAFSMILSFRNLTSHPTPERLEDIEKGVFNGKDFGISDCYKSWEDITRAFIHAVEFVLGIQEIKISSNTKEEKVAMMKFACEDTTLLESLHCKYLPYINEIEKLEGIRTVVQTLEKTDKKIDTLCQKSEQKSLMFEANIAFEKHEKEVNLFCDTAEKLKVVFSSSAKKRFDGRIQTSIYEYKRVMLQDKTSVKVGFKIKSTEQILEQYGNQPNPSIDPLESDIGKSPAKSLWEELTKSLIKLFKQRFKLDIEVEGPHKWQLGSLIIQVSLLKMDGSDWLPSELSKIDSLLSQMGKTVESFFPFQCSCTCSREDKSLRTLNEEIDELQGCTEVEVGFLVEGKFEKQYDIGEVIKDVKDNTHLSIRRICLHAPKESKTDYVKSECLLIDAEKSLEEDSSKPDPGSPNMGFDDDERNLLHPQSTSSLPKGSPSISLKSLTPKALKKNNKSKQEFQSNEALLQHRRSLQGSRSIKDVMKTDNVGPRYVKLDDVKRISQNSDRQSQHGEGNEDKPEYIGAFRPTSEFLPFHGYGESIQANEAKLIKKIIEESN